MTYDEYLSDSKAYMSRSRASSLDQISRHQCLIALEFNIQHSVIVLLHCTNLLFIRFENVAGVYTFSFCFWEVVVFGLRKALGQEILQPVFPHRMIYTTKQMYERKKKKKDRFLRLNNEAVTKTTTTTKCRMESCLRSTFQCWTKAL